MQQNAGRGKKVPALTNGQPDGWMPEHKKKCRDSYSSVAPSSALSSPDSASASMAAGAGGSSSSLPLPKSGSQLGFSSPSSFRKPN